jgi:hypothetical protein
MRSTIMRKILSLAIVAAALALAACCVGSDGDVYLSFNWTYTPEWFATNDPNLPDTIYRTVEYPVEEGTWYFEYYHADSGCKRWITYTLEAHEGFLLGMQGEDAVFELFLHAYSDPAFIQWQNIVGEAADQPEEVHAATVPVSTAEQRVPDFKQTMERGGWTLKIQSGVIEQ